MHRSFIIASLLLSAAVSSASAVEPSIVAKLIAKLADEDEDVRWKAAYQLGKWGPEAKEALTTLKTIAVHDKAESVRATAKRAIAKIHGLPEIIDAIRDGKRPERAAAAKALGLLGEDGKEVTEKLVEALFFWEPASRDEFLDALQKINPRVHKPIAVLLLDKDPSHQLAAVKEIGRLPQDRATTVCALLAVYYSSTHPPQRGREWEKVAEVTLATLETVAPGDRRIVGLSPSAPVEMSATPTDVAELARWLADLDNPEFAVREHASEQLAKAGAGAEEALWEHLSATSSLEVKWRISELLTALGANNQLHLLARNRNSLYQPHLSGR